LTVERGARYSALTRLFGRANNEVGKMRNTMRVLGAVVILSAIFAIGCAAEPATVEISPPDVTVNAITDSPKLTAKVMDER
jgi:uncharacterized lipoprotein YajG